MFHRANTPRKRIQYFGAAWRNSRSLFVLTIGIILLTGYANAAFLVTHPSGYRWFPPFTEGENANSNMHLGAEYFNIAVAIASGRGFSDPFRVETGPTAWMPPVYPTLLAALLLLFGTKGAVAFCIVLFKTCVLVLTGATIQRLAKISSQVLRPEMALVMYFLWLLSNFFWFFQITHDIWLNLLLVNVILMAAPKLWNKELTKGTGIAWGCLGGLACLSNPVLAVAWFVVGAPVAKHKTHRRAMMISLCVAAAIVTPWLLRNWIAFDKVFFVKSNLSYELYQANYVCEDGVYDELFFFNHPVWTTGRDPDSAYARVGEVAFLRMHRSRFIEALRAHPGV